MKRVVSILLALVLLAGVAYAADIQTEGTCGQNLTWSLKNGVLRISGTGPMEDYDFMTAPWYRAGFKNPPVSVVVESGVTTIGRCAFYGLQISSISIPNTVVRIGDYALSIYKYDQPIEVALPASLRELSLAGLDSTGIISFRVDAANPVYSTLDGVLYNKDRTELLRCPGARTTPVQIPSTVKKIGQGAFSSGKITAQTIPDSVTSMGEIVFSGCRSLKSAVLSKNITEVPASIFNECDDLEEVVIPEGVTKIGITAFSGCVNLKRVTLPNSLEWIDQSAFSRCEKLDGVVLPSNLKYLGQSAFAICYSLSSIQIPASLEVIQANTFHACRSLTSVTLPETLTEIGATAFDNAGVRRITIPASVTRIGAYAFRGSDLATVEIKNGAATIGEGVFVDCDRLQSVKLPSNMTTIPKGMFRNCGTLLQIELPEGVTKIAPDAFRDCTALKKVTLPSTTDLIYNNAFRNCPALTKIELPEGMRGLDSEVFWDCTYLTDLYLPKSLQVMGNDVLKNCSSLKSVDYGGDKAAWSSIKLGENAGLGTTIAINYNVPAPGKPGTTNTQQNKLRSFDDLPAGHWAHSYAMRCVEEGAINGTRIPDANGVGSYDPNGSVTLGQFLAVVTRLVCPGAVQDVTGHWATGNYLAALSSGIIQFRDFEVSYAALEAPLSREDMAYILANTATFIGENLTAKAGAAAQIQDYGKISDNRVDAVLKCYSAGLLTGHGNGNFAPKDTMTRAEMAVVVCRLMNFVPRAAVNFN